MISKNYADVPLIKEITAVKRYLEIEKKRYEEKLQVEYNIAANAEEYAIPSFLIHPLVENAVKYGMRTSVIPLKIIISATVKNEQLTITVSNTGSWVEQNTQNPFGNSTCTGLENIRKRLANAYPDSHRLEIIKVKDKVTVIIEITKIHIPK
ncbi:MAG: hypothetical protein V1720_22490 [bacterium]